MSFPEYDQYKESGIELLGEIPFAWKIRRLSTICTFQSGKAHEPFIDDYGEFICVNSRFVSTEGETRKFCTENLSPARRNDILMVMSDLPNGRALAKAFFVDDDEPYAVNQRVCILSAHGAHPRFLFYLLNRNPLFLMHDDGVNQTHLSNATFTKFPALLPPLDEQKAIASFLDVETSKIDALVTEQWQLIELLKEKRQAVISHAVTKGLNPNSPMKPSGIQLLGDVPEHWNSSTLRWYCESIRDGTHTPPPRSDGVHRLLSVRNIINGEFVLRDDDRTMNPDAFAELQRSYTVEPGDVLLAIVGGTTGKSAVAPKLENVTVQRSLAILRPRRTHLDSYFLNYWIQSDSLQGKIRETAVKYAAQPGIYLDDVAGLAVPIPPITEQTKIVASLNAQTGKLKMLVAEAERAIELLQERRTALISAAVTGKIDVREFAYQETL